jgi:hypothetical protein
MYPFVLWYPGEERDIIREIPAKTEKVSWLFTDEEALGFQDVHCCSIGNAMPLCQITCCAHLLLA